MAEVIQFGPEAGLETRRQVSQESCSGNTTTVDALSSLSSSITVAQPCAVTTQAQKASSGSSPR